MQTFSLVFPCKCKTKKCGEKYHWKQQYLLHRSEFNSSKLWSIDRTLVLWNLKDINLNYFNPVYIVCLPFQPTSAFQSHAGYLLISILLNLFQNSLFFFFTFVAVQMLFFQKECFFLMLVLTSTQDKTMQKKGKERQENHLCCEYNKKLWKIDIYNQFHYRKFTKCQVKSYFLVKKFYHTFVLLLELHPFKSQCW